MPPPPRCHRRSTHCREMCDTELREVTRMSSSPIPDHSFNSQELPSARPELQRESDRLKLLLDMTNTLVSNLELRDLLCAVSPSIRHYIYCDDAGQWLPEWLQVQL